MPAVTITVDDLAPFAEIDSVKAQAMIDDTLARAARVAPCILDDTFEYADAAKAILRGAILRWNETGTGALAQHSVTRGPFAEAESYDTRQPRKSLFWPSEIEELQELCALGQPGGAFSFSTIPASAELPNPDATA